MDEGTGMPTTFAGVTDRRGEVPAFAGMTGSMGDGTTTLAAPELADIGARKRLTPAQRLKQVTDLHKESVIRAAQPPERERIWLGH